MAHDKCREIRQLSHNRSRLYDRRTIHHINGRLIFLKSHRCSGVFTTSCSFSLSLGEPSLTADILDDEAPAQARPTYRLA